MTMKRSQRVGVLLLCALVMAGCAANRDAKEKLRGGYAREANDARFEAQEQKKRNDAIRDAQVMAEEDKIAVDDMLKAGQTASNQLDVDLARVNRQGKGSSRERAALTKELADIKLQTASVQKQRAAPQVSPEELARSRKKLEELTARRKKLADDLERALKS